MNFLKTTVFFVAAGALLASTASQAQDAPPGCGSVTPLQKRVVERADQGIESLRSFLWTARVTHGIGMQDVRTGLDTWRAAVNCQKDLAAAAAAAADVARASASASASAPASAESASQVVAATR